MRKPFLFGTGLLLCLLLSVVEAGVAIAHETGSAAADCVGPRQEVGRPERASSKSAGSGLKKALASKSPRRTDIPEALLIVMLALIGVVVISRRDVSGKDQSALPEKGLKTER